MTCLFEHATVKVIMKSKELQIIKDYLSGIPVDSLEFKLVLTNLIEQIENPAVTMANKRAAKLTPDKRSEIAKKAAKGRWG